MSTPNHPAPRAAFTPAPWTVQDGTLTVYTLTKSTTNAIAAACYHNHDGGSDISYAEAKANAALIAAAPELYAALEACMFALGREGANTLNGKFRAEWLAARAALAKAAGQSS